VAPAPDIIIGLGAGIVIDATGGAAGTFIEATGNFMDAAGGAAGSTTGAGAGAGAGTGAAGAATATVAPGATALETPAGMG